MARVSFVEDLASGEFGLRATVPAHLSVTEDLDDSAVAVDPETGLRWWFFFFPDLHLDLDPAHLPVLKRDIERHTRLLFEVMFAHAALAPDFPRSLDPRTDDASWSPVIEIEPFEITGGAALSVLHRMQYLPGLEIVMGHTLVPTAKGLFEARWLSRAQMTGYRESSLMMATLKDDEDVSFPSQAEYDDPAHDAAFPEHPVSLARVAKRWHRDGMSVTARPSTRSAASVELEALGCTMTVPPRYVMAGPPGSDGGSISQSFCRVSFSGTDGVDRLVVTRVNETLRAFGVDWRLARLATKWSRSWFQSSGFVDVTCELHGSSAREVTVLTEGDAGSSQGRGRAVWRWFVDVTGQVWSIAAVTTIAVPVEELVTDLDAIARSFRPHTA